MNFQLDIYNHSDFLIFSSLEPHCADKVELIETAKEADRQKVFVERFAKQTQRRLEQVL